MEAPKKLKLGPPPRSRVQRRRSWRDRNYFTPPKCLQRRSAIFTILADMSMITATAWVPRGFAAPFPERYVFDEDEYERIAHLAKLQLEDAKEELEEAQNEETEASNGTSGNVAKEKNTEYGEKFTLSFFTMLILL
jgi:hypothetical protein